MPCFGRNGVPSFGAYSSESRNRADDIESIQVKPLDVDVMVCTVLLISPGSSTRWSWLTKLPTMTSAVRTLEHMVWFPVLSTLENHGGYFKARSTPSWHYCCPKKIKELKANSSEWGKFQTVKPEPLPSADMLLMYLLWGFRAHPMSSRETRRVDRWTSGHFQKRFPEMAVYDLRGFGDLSTPS